MDFNIKLITQYPERLHIHQLKSPDDIFEVDHEDEICEGDEQDHLGIGQVASNLMGDI